MDLRRAKTLVFAVVPFDQVVIDLGLGAKASQLACAASSLRWARKYTGAAPSSEVVTEVASVTFSTLNHWQSGKISMLA